MSTSKNNHTLSTNGGVNRSGSKSARQGNSHPFRQKNNIDSGINSTFEDRKSARQTSISGKMNENAVMRATSGGLSQHLMNNVMKKNKSDRNVVLGNSAANNDRSHK